MDFSLERELSYFQPRPYTHFISQDIVNIAFHVDIFIAMKITHIWATVCLWVVFPFLSNVLF